MNNRKGSLLIALGLVLITAALVLAAWNIVEADRAARASLEAVEKLEQLIPTQPEPEPDTTDPAETEPTQPGFSIEDYPGREMPTWEVNGYRYIGILEIPAAGLKLPIMEDWDEERLKIAPCRYSGSLYQDDLVISGHNYGKHFSAIRWQKIGTEVIFTDADGHVFRYEIVEYETLQPHQVEEMITGDWDLTLFTCNLGGDTRYAVRCERIKE